MKSLLVKLGAILVAIFIIFSASSHAGDLDKPYSPTRKEWLEMSIFKLIKIRTDPWQQRIGFLVWVVEKENTAFITLTSANGQGDLTKEQQDTYVKNVRGDIESFLEEYKWSINLKVFVQFK